jgi:hypothetical protein
MMFGVTEYIAFSNGRRVVITDPNQTNDPLSEALAAVAIEVKTRREQVWRLEGRRTAPSDSPDSLDLAIEVDKQI